MSFCCASDVFKQRVGKGKRGQDRAGGASERQTAVTGIGGGRSLHGHDGVKTARRIGSGRGDQPAGLLCVRSVKNLLAWRRRPGGMNKVRAPFKRAAELAARNDFLARVTTLFEAHPADG